MLGGGVSRVVKASGGCGSVKLSGVKRLSLWCRPLICSLPGTGVGVTHGGSAIGVDVYGYEDPCSRLVGQCDGSVRMYSSGVEGVSRTRLFRADDHQPALTNRVLMRGAKKSALVYVCDNCGMEHIKYSGRCHSCGQYNSLKEFRPAPAATAASKGKRPVRQSSSKTVSPLMGARGSSDVFNTLTPLGDIKQDSTRRIRLPSREMDRLLGGGLTTGSVTLIGGPPGVGKSTLMLQLAAMLAEACESTERAGDTVAYVSGEESAHQIKNRALRLGVDSDNVMVLNETDLGAILQQVEEAGDVGALIVDSVQTIFAPELSSSAGGVSQVKEVATQLLQYAKATDVPVLLVGHVTKSGDLAGPRVLEHLVDTVLYMEGDSTSSTRILRAEKNRFGSTAEVGIFDMNDEGFCEVADPSHVFVTPHDDSEEPIYGRAVAATLEGSRPMCVEVQALASPTPFEYPRHRCSGFGMDRMFMLLAVLQRYARLVPRGNDVFLNAVGGIRISDPAVDVAVCMALASSLADKPLPSDVAYIGEVGLGGELRSVPHVSARLSAMATLGYSRVVIPATIVSKSKPKSQQRVSLTPRRGGGGDSSGDHNLKKAARKWGIQLIEARSIVDVVLRL